MVISSGRLAMVVVRCWSLASNASGWGVEEEEEAAMKSEVNNKGRTYYANWSQVLPNARTAGEKEAVSFPFRFCLPSLQLDHVPAAAVSSYMPTEPALLAHASFCVQQSYL